VSGPIALLGAGEFEDWHDDVDRWLLDRADGDGRVLIAPLASAAEGDDVFASWAAKGLDHYGRLGVPAQVLPLKTRADAERPEVLEMLEGASMLFFSGGNPWYVAQTLTGTPFWSRMCARLGEGMAYAGCSAGVACLTETTYDSNAADLDRVFQRGLGYVQGVLFAPHWDVLEDWVPGAKAAITSATPSDGVLVALDEDTAMVGDTVEWTVHGRQEIHLFRDGTWTDHGAGDRFSLPLPIGSV
jgi:cyanophycinase